MGVRVTVYCEPVKTWSVRDLAAVLAGKFGLPYRQIQESLSLYLKTRPEGSLSLDLEAADEPGSYEEMRYGVQGMTEDWSDWTYLEDVMCSMCAHTMVDPGEYLIKA